MTSNAPKTVSIRPGVSVLSVLRHLNYQPWFALAEFVDNSLQSYHDNRDSLKNIHGATYKLKVTLDIDLSDGGRLVIRDNAAGIHEGDYPRAFRPAAIPPDRSGFCEFGMGMKSAACWFSPYWTVRTKALGESVERSVVFDIDKIINDNIEELTITERPAARDSHFTEIILSQLHRTPQKRTLGKIKEHLADIYRLFTNSGEMELQLNGDPLRYEQPEILIAPHFRDPKGIAVRWSKEFDFDFGLGLRAHGFAAIRRVASTSRAGFALFRRGRLIQGSGDEGYRPEEIFGKANSFEYQRIFGEIHLEGFDVSHTKDGFQWNEHEDVFLECLRAELEDQSLPLLHQSREHRTRKSKSDLKAGADIAVKNTAEAIESNVPEVLDALGDKLGIDSPPTSLRSVSTVTNKNIEIEYKGSTWKIHLELSDDPEIGDWLEISEQHVGSGTSTENYISLRLSLVHPFMERFGGSSSSEIEPLLRIAAGIGLAEVLARQSGVKMAGTIRRNLNELLRDALSRP